jgi:hypothetical protein
MKILSPTPLYAMAFPRAKAISVIEDNLRPVAEHLAKIFCHAPSGYDNKWEKDLETFFYVIIRHANNITSGNGKLPASVLVEKLNDCAVVAEANVPVTFRFDKLKGLRKSSKGEDLPAEIAAEYLLPELIALSPKIASLILQNNILLRREIAELLASTTKRIRDEYLIK